MDLVRQLPPGATVQAIVAGARTEALFGDWLPAGEAVAAALGEVPASEGGFDLSAALREAARQAARAPGAPVNLVLLGDLQAPAAGTGDAEAAQALKGARELRVLLREIPPDRGAVGGVVAVEVPRRALRPGETAQVRATVVPARAGQVFTLELDGATVAEAVATGQPGRATDLDFAITVPAAGLHAGWVRTDSDILAVDDRRPFVLAVPPALDVLVVHGPDRPGDGPAGRGGWRYLAQALAPGGAPGAFAVSARASDEVTTAALTEAAVVALVDPGPLGRAGLDALAARPAAGRGILLAAGDPLLVSHLDQVLLPALGLPAPAPVASVPPPGVHARVVDASHPLLAGLDDTARRSLEDVRWRRWLSHRPEGSRVVLELSTGEPLLLERESGPGRLAVLATGFGEASGDLARSPLVVPLLQRTCSWLGGGSAQDGAATALAGQAVGVRPRPRVPVVMPGSGADPGGGPAGEPAGGDPSGRAASGGASPGGIPSAGILAVGPAPDRREAAELAWRNGQPWLTAGPADRAGFVAFLAGADTVGLVAVGVPPDETLGSREGAAGWRRRLAGLGLPVAAQLVGDGEAALGGALAGRDLAPWAFLLAALVLALELAAGTGRGRGGS